jgi:hypothetical protein
VTVPVTRSGVPVGVAVALGTDELDGGVGLGTSVPAVELQEARAAATTSTTAATVGGRGSGFPAVVDITPDLLDPGADH